MLTQERTAQKLAFERSHGTLSIIDSADATQLNSVTLARSERNGKMASVILALM